MSKEEEHVKKRNHLKEKYQKLTKGNMIQIIRGHKSLSKIAVLNLTSQAIPQSSGTSKSWTYDCCKQ